MPSRKRKPKKGQAITGKRVDNADVPVLPDAAVAKPEPEDDPWGKDRLTLKQRRFVRHYVTDAAGNATKAAELAGYNANNRISLANTASENLRKPYIQRAISRALAKYGGGKKATLAGIVELATANMADFVQVDDQGRVTIDIKRAHEAAAMGRVKKIRVCGSGDDQEITLETYDRLAALRTLAEIHGKLVTHHEVSGPGGGAVPVTFDHEQFAKQFSEYATRRLHGECDPAASENGN
jgi:phage terminase small subunit